MRKAWVKVPGSSGNLGSAFDVAAAAIQVYFELEIEVVDPRQGDLVDLKNMVMALSFPILRRAFPKNGFRWKMKNGIPMGKGLGSSAAARLGALSAARLLALSEEPSMAVVQKTASLEGHYDNAAASWKGGLALAWSTRKNLEISSWKMPPDLKAVVCVPDFSLSTDRARRILPQQIAREDAVFNLSREAALLSAIKNRQYQWLREGLQDRLHQKYRAKLIPGLNDAIEAALKAGAYGACLSGAGPSVLALASTPAHDLERIGRLMEGAFKRRGVSAQHRIWAFSNKGLDWDISAAAR